MVESVQAYLHTFNLSEKTLVAGLTIPWASGGELIGTARATGRLGPHGHQIYEVFDLYTHGVAASVGAGVVEVGHEFVEIAPEP